LNLCIVPGYPVLKSADNIIWTETWRLPTNACSRLEPSPHVPEPGNGRWALSLVKGLHPLIARKYMRIPQSMFGCCAALSCIAPKMASTAAALSWSAAQEISIPSAEGKMTVTKKTLAMGKFVGAQTVDLLYAPDLQ
jgi:hypothetical protein